MGKLSTLAPGDTAPIHRRKRSVHPFIENFIIDVTDVQGNFMLQLFDKHTMEMKQETPKNINDFEWKYVIGNANLTKNGSLYIIGLSFDFKNKTCKVTL